MIDTPQSMGGVKRAESLPPEKRQAIARQAALARWQPNRAPIDPNRIPDADRQGEMIIGDVEIKCYVLDDERRVIHKRGMAKALGLKSKGGNAFLKSMSRNSIGSRLPPELWAKINNPIVFNAMGRDPGHGYEATVLIELCDALLQMREDLLPAQKFLAVQAEIIIRAAAKLGIIALVDEATGYIADKRKEEYRELFKDFIREECRQWEQEFPDAFFDLLYRLYGLKRRNPKSVQHPRFFARLIRKYIYYPLANSNGAILEGLDEKNPIVYVNGGRRYKLHSFLSDTVGVSALRQHLWQVVGIGNSVPNKAAFDRAFQYAFPQPNSQMELFPN
jgi:hypothetical protein